MITMMLAAVLSLSPPAGMFDPPQAATAQPTVAELLARIEALEARIAELEARDTPQASAARQAISTPPAARVMRVLRIDPLPVDPEPIRAMIATTQAKRDGLDRELREMDGSLASRRAAPALRARIKDLDDELATLRREASTTHRRIVGWNGSQYVALTTTLASVDDVARIQPGAFIGWTGTRLSFTAELDSWAISACSAAREPAGYADPPASKPLPAFPSPPAK